MSTPSPLSLRALAWCQDKVARGIRGGLPGWGHFRGLEVDEYLKTAGYELPVDRSERGLPWCMAAQYAAEKASETEDEKSSCPRTGGTLRAAAEAPEHCRLDGPRPGAVGILMHADGKTGHAVRCEAVFEDGSVTTVEGDSSPTMSSVGDQWCRHTWSPASGMRGKLLAWYDFGHVV